MSTYYVEFQTPYDELVLVNPKQVCVLSDGGDEEDGKGDTTVITFPNGAECVVLGGIRNVAQRLENGDK